MNASVVVCISCYASIHIETIFCNNQGLFLYFLALLKLPKKAKDFVHYIPFLSYQFTTFFSLKGILVCFFVRMYTQYINNDSFDGWVD